VHNKKTVLISCVIILILSAVYLSYGYFHFDLRRYLFDEGITAYGATLIQDGSLPYRDFWSFHAPGRFFLLAGVFNLFGASLQVFVFFTFFVLSIIAVELYLFVFRIYGRILGLAAVLFFLAWTKMYMVYNRPSQFALLIFMLSCFPLYRYIFSGGKKWLILSGCLAGIMAWFKLDFLLFFIICVFPIVALRADRAARENRVKNPKSAIFKSCIVLYFGLLTTALPALIYFLVKGGNAELQSYVLSGLWQKNHYFNFPGFNFKFIMFYVPIVTFFASTLYLIIQYRNKNARSVSFQVMFFFLLFGVCLHTYSVRRLDEYRLWVLSAPTIIIFIGLWDAFTVRLVNSRKIVAYALLFVSALLSFCALLPYHSQLRQIMSNVSEGRIDILRGKGFYDSSKHASSQLQALKYIQDNTDPSEKIFVCNIRHDRLTNNDVMFYFLAGRKSATKYYQFEPGFTTTKVIQDRIIRDLKETGVRYIVLWKLSDEYLEENESSVSSGITDLDDFIKNNFELRKDFGEYLVLGRKPVVMEKASKF